MDSMYGYNEEESIMDQVGNVYSISYFYDDVVGEYMMPPSLTEFETMGELYNELVKEYGAPIENELKKQVVRLLFECGTCRYITVI